MEFVQSILIASAVFGGLASTGEPNLNGVSDDAARSLENSRDQVTSVTQFSDVYPTDWAYQALSNLVEQYGCVAGYPNGTFRGNRAMTRYEAAALLNACLDRVTEVTDELRRLISEFETELAVLRGRVDGLEARVGELEATQFSTTTKLKGYDTPDDGQFIWEAWLQLNVTDAITVTPALFYLSRPLGQNTPRGETFQQLGGLAKITYSF